MKRAYLPLVIAVMIGLNTPPAFAQNPRSTLARDAQRLADCMTVLDANCVIELSDVQGFERLSRPGFSFGETQSRYFDLLKRRGIYTRYVISAPSEIFGNDGRMYAFLPYVSERQIEGGRAEAHAYFIAKSDDGGNSWKFLDARSVTPENIRLIVPSYSGQDLPPVRMGQVAPGQ
jgi:hypothetical protein